MADEQNPEGMSDEEAAMAKAMEAAAEGGPEGVAAAEGEPEKVLNQDEIDLLLGFDSKEDGGKTGIMAILDKTLTAYEKMPMLEVVFDRLVRSLSSSLRNFTSDNCDVSIESMSSVRFDEYINSVPMPTLLAVFRAVEWENFGLINVDSSQIYSTVDILLGGRRHARPVRIEGRPYTTIEQDIVRKMTEIVLADLSTAFDPLSPVTFQFERLENNPRFATITRPSNAGLLVRLRVDMDDRGGVIEILLPHVTLEPIRDLLLQMFMGEKFGQDSVWEKHLGKEVRHTNLDLEVILDEKMLALGDVARFSVGSTIMLDCSPEDDVIIKCGGVAVTKGKVGCVGDSVAVSINMPIIQRVKEPA